MLNSQFWRFRLDSLQPVLRHLLPVDHRFCPEVSPQSVAGLNDRSSLFFGLIL